MAYEAKTYRILIASPSDVKDEREIAVNVIQEWNDLHSYSRKLVLLPLRWETHVSPEYGVRPQDVINKQIVDQCDLVVGIFWTRLGSPTGKFESGTLEEIQRAAELGKPVMIFFSEKEIQPEKIDIEQLKKLRKFKEKVYSVALVETYKSIYEFKEKFAKNLEIKIKEIHEKGEKDNTFFDFGIFSIEDEIIKKHYTWEIDRIEVTDINKLSQNKQDQLKKLIDIYTNNSLYCPLLFAIKNLTSISLQYLYIELEMFLESGNLDIMDNIPKDYYSIDAQTSFIDWEFSTGQNIPIYPYNIANINKPLYITFEYPETGVHPVVEKVNNILYKYKPKKLYQKENSWKICFEIDVLQPQRLQILEPPLYIKSLKESSLLIKSKIYTDLFLKPYEFDLKLEIKITRRQIKYKDLPATWIKLIEKNG